jgi:excisionase family DNA binding protein
MANKPTASTEGRAARCYGSVEAAAQRLGCSPRTVRRMIADGEIVGYRLGKRLLRVDLAEIDSALRRIPTADGVA